MSTRTALTVVEAGVRPELGQATKTEENSDVSNGNKVPWLKGLAIIARNSTGVSKTVTYSYDERGQVRTLALTLAANEMALLIPDAGMVGHAGDAEDGTHVWLTASGTAGEVKFRALSIRGGLL